MQPLSQGTAVNTSILGEVLSDRDRLLVDIDFFDAKGHWNPHKVMFCASDRTERASSLWTRCFGGLMALHANLWVKNYLQTQFPLLEKSRVLITQINKAGFVDKKTFIETAAHCSLLSKPPAELVKSEKLAEANPITANPVLKNTRDLVFKYIARTNWSAWGEKEFEQMTLPMAMNIRDFLNDLAIEEDNPQLVETMNNMLRRYLDWLGDPPEELSTRNSSADSIDTKLANEKYKIREIIFNEIWFGIGDYKTIKKQLTILKEEADPEIQKKRELIDSLMSKFEAEMERCSKKIFFSQSFVVRLDESGLIEYLKHGKVDFGKDGNLELARKIIALPNEMLRKILDFLDDSEFSFLQDRFKQLRGEIL